MPGGLPFEVSHGEGAAGGGNMGMTPWLPFGEKGQLCHGNIEWKMIHTDADDPRWTVLIRGQEGDYINPHIHDGQAEGWMFSGGIQLGRESNMVGRSPAWFREGAGAHHPHTILLGDCLFYLTMIGPITWVQDDESMIKTTAQQAQVMWNNQLEQFLGDNPDYKDRYDEYMKQMMRMRG